MPKEFIPSWMSGKESISDLRADAKPFVPSWATADACVNITEGSKGCGGRQDELEMEFDELFNAEDDTRAKTPSSCGDLAYSSSPKIIPTSRAVLEAEERELAESVREGATLLGTSVEDQHASPPASLGVGGTHQASHPGALRAPTPSASFRDALMRHPAANNDASSLSSSTSSTLSPLAVQSFVASHGSGAAPAAVSDHPGTAVATPLVPVSQGARCGTSPSNHRQDTSTSGERGSIASQSPNGLPRSGLPPKPGTILGTIASLSTTSASVNGPDTFPFPVADASAPLFPIHAVPSVNQDSPDLSTFLGSQVIRSESDGAAEAGSLPSGLAENAHNAGACSPAGFCVGVSISVREDASVALSLSVLSSTGIVNQQKLAKKKIGLEDFEILRVVGRGAYGKVLQVRHRERREIFALKVISKQTVSGKNAEYTRVERDVLAVMAQPQTSHPFMCGLHWAFQTAHKLYFVMDFVNGGGLFHHLKKQKMISEEHVRFYAAELVVGLQHLHTLGIIHRDLKPENILLSSDGHIVVTDFGLAKDNAGTDRTHSFCGTYEYMAPEMIAETGHSYAADWWSLGALLYDMLAGEPPFTDKQGRRKQLQERICSSKVKYPRYLTSDAVAVLKGLLQRDVAKRFGFKELKKCKFFRNVRWPQVVQRQTKPPFIPTVDGLLDVSQFDDKYTCLPPEDSPVIGPPLSSSQQELFAGFSYESPSDLRLPEAFDRHRIAQ
eukprot:Rmarinus@m.13424